MVINVEDHKIALDGALNVRDLGGYPTEGGGITKTGVFLRSDSLHNLTEADISALKSLGVTMQVDLRSTNEVLSKPSKLLGIEGIAYYHVSFLDNVQSSGFSNMPNSMAEMYCGLLDSSREKYAKTFRAFLANQGSCIFNCTAGKDRTGMVAMCLLKLADVKDTTIIADYSVSAANLTAAMALQKIQLEQAGYRLPDYIFDSDPKDMEITLDYLNQKYGGAIGYLSFCGLTRIEIEQLRRRMIV
ncbi:MAG: tyrosine-protein phosphatase [Acetanaerobacterium sp.]